MQPNKWWQSKIETFAQLEVKDQICPVWTKLQSATHAATWKQIGMHCKVIRKWCTKYQHLDWSTSQFAGIWEARFFLHGRSTPTSVLMAANNRRNFVHLRDIWRHEDHKVTNSALQVYKCSMSKHKQTKEMNLHKHFSHEREWLSLVENSRISQVKKHVLQLLNSTNKTRTSAQFLLPHQCQRVRTPQWAQPFQLVGFLRKETNWISQMCARSDWQSA